MPVAFSWSIDLGQIVIVVSSLSSVLAGFFALKAKIEVMDGKFAQFQEVIVSMKQEISQIREVIVSNARLDERVAALSVRLTTVEAREREKR